MIAKERLFSIAAAVLLHLLVLFFAAWTIKTAVTAAAERSLEVRLVDVQERPEEKPVREQVPREDPVAETVVETDEHIQRDENPAVDSEAGEGIDYLSMAQASVLPRFLESEIKKRMVYPPIAQRAGIEGQVILELFVDKSGLVRNVRVLREDPPDRGFGEAAAAIFRGLKGAPALADGEQVAVRYRHPIKFELRG